MSEKDRYVKAAGLSEIQQAGLKTVQLEDRVVLLVHHEGQVFAVDNRCPHMGFPLARGSVKNGVLTCHWHHARFDLCSGGTFDLFADDVRRYPLELRADEVWLDPHPERDEVSYQQGRLQDGLEQNIRLVMAKSVISLMDHGEDPASVLSIAGVFGVTQRNAGWRDGLTIMTAMARCLQHVRPEDKPLALYHGMLHVADNVVGQRPHFELEPLATDEVSLTRLKAWLRDFAEVRDRDGVERVLLTALQKGLSDHQVADILLAAVSDHYFLDNGHSVDFLNKAFELLDIIGWQQAARVLPSIIPAITNATRMEETSSWRIPVDLVALQEAAFTELAHYDLAEKRLVAEDFNRLVATLLGDDPEAIVRELSDSLAQGIALTDISLALSFAAATRVARFHTSNEFNDWISVLHSFTSSNATHQLLKRAASLEGARSIFHCAMHLYLNRFLNAPAARQPSVVSVAALPGDAKELLGQLLELTNQRQKVEEAAALSYRYALLGHDDGPLLQTLAHILLREDGEFHSYQLLEAGLQLYQELKPLRPDLAPTVLVAITRYLAGHAPTDRATTQSYRIASRLHRGEALDAE